MLTFTQEIKLFGNNLGRIRHDIEANKADKTFSSLRQFEIQIKEQLDFLKNYIVAEDCELIKVSVAEYYEVFGICAQLLQKVLAKFKHDTQRGEIFYLKRIIVSFNNNDSFHLTLKGKSISEAYSDQCFLLKIAHNLIKAISSNENAKIKSTNNMSNEKKETGDSYTFNAPVKAGAIGKNNQVTNQFNQSFDEIKEGLQKSGLQKSYIRELETLLEELNSTSNKSKASICEKGVEWVTKHGKGLGALSETIIALFR